MAPICGKCVMGISFCWKRLRIWHEADDATKSAPIVVMTPWRAGNVSLVERGIVEAGPRASLSAAVGPAPSPTSRARGDRPVRRQIVTWSPQVLTNPIFQRGGWRRNEGTDQRQIESITPGLRHCHGNGSLAVKAKT